MNNSPNILKNAKKVAIYVRIISNICNFVP